MIMAMTIDMNALAQMGARARLAELDEERAALLRAFPALRTSGQAPAVKAGMGEPETRRRRRKMTPAQRKAVGERMRKYWAARRKAERQK